MKGISLFVFFFYCSSIWAQAEYKKVREMFSVPHVNIDIHVYKGHLDEVHPVEFFLGVRANEVHGYYRLVSSGQTFLLSGEWSDNLLILTEDNTLGNQVGELIAKDFDFHSGGILNVRWQSITSQDILDFTLMKTDITDYAPLAFKSTFTKYCDYQNEECITIETFEEEKAELMFLASAKRVFCEVLSLNPLRLQTRDSIIYEQVNNKIRVKSGSTFQYFTKEKEAKIKRMYYASHYLLSDVEFPELGHNAFDKFMMTLIDEEKEKVRKAIKELKEKEETLHSSVHYNYKWSGWTEIDYLGSTMISGRIILNSYIGEDAYEKVIPFVFDLVEEQASSVLDEFKKDVDVLSFFKKRIKAELAESPDLQLWKAEDFQHFSLSDEFVLISTDFSTNYGQATIRIPYAELKNWMKRSSLIKKIMRN